MLTEKKIEKNYDKLVATNTKYQFLTEEFFTQFGEEIKNGVSLNASYQEKGDLIHFALTVTKYAVMINGVLPKPKQFSEAEVIKMGIMYSLRNLAETSGEAFFKEEVISRNLFRFVSTGCQLNAEEFNFIGNDLPFVKASYALGNLINNAIELAELEVVLPESENVEA